jgi:multidrug resistance efflux pump
MILVIVLYVGIVWLLFWRFKVIRFGFASGTLATLVGAFILALFVALFNYLTPSGTFVVSSRVVEVTPDVAGEVVAIPVRPNVLVEKGAVLFQIDGAPFRNKIVQLEAALEQARQQAEQLRANYAQASANVEAMNAQVDYTRKRLADVLALTERGASSEFKQQDAQIQHDTAVFQLQAAEAAQASARIAAESEIAGVSTSVAQIQAQLDDARWSLEQTTVRAPADGYVGTMALSIGNRVVTARSAMAFIVAGEAQLIGTFRQNGFRTIRVGAPVRLVFLNDPGHVHESVISDIPRGIGQGQVATSGILARTGSVGGTGTYPALIALPNSIERGRLHVGMSGTATVFAPNAGVIGTLMSILVWIDSYLTYL